MGVENDIGTGFGEPGGTSPPRITSSTPLQGSGAGCKSCHHDLQRGMPLYCVVPENIHTPPPPTEYHWKSWGRGGDKGSYFRGAGGGGVYWKLLFQRVMNHEQNNESNIQSIISIKTYVRCFETKLSTPGHWDQVNIIGFNVSVFLWVS